jgi:3-hydroxybutyryl-CoA dehydrogenase
MRVGSIPAESPRRPTAASRPSAAPVRAAAPAVLVYDPGREEVHVEIQRIGIIGGGLMGSGIAEICARAGLDVLVREVDPDAVEGARRRIERSLERALRANKIEAVERDAALQRIRLVTEYEALADRHLVVEAVAEDSAVKEEVFGIVGRLLKDPAAILASNTSSIPIMKLAMASERPETVLGMHFFNPVPVLRLMELVPTLLTAPDTTTAAEDLARDRLGRRVVHSKDRAGFVVNALLVPYILSSIRMFESGFATRDDVDLGMVEGCNHPMGPLALADLIGLDTLMAVAESLYEEFKEPLYAPPPLLHRMVEAGLLGRKTSRGFYEYER